MIEKQNQQSAVRHEATSNSIETHDYCKTKREENQSQENAKGRVLLLGFDSFESGDSMYSSGVILAQFHAQWIMGIGPSIHLIIMHKGLNCCNVKSPARHRLLKSRSHVIF